MLNTTISPSGGLREKKSCFQPSIGSIVNIQSRTWPGINKPGGVGRITAVYYDDNKENTKVTHVDVKYVVNGGSETNVDCVFVREYHLHGNEGKERSRRAKLRKIERETLKRKNPDHENENVQCNVKSVTNQSSIKKRKKLSKLENSKTNSRPSYYNTTKKTNILYSYSTLSFPNSIQFPQKNTKTNTETFKDSIITYYKPSNYSGEEWKMKQNTFTKSITLPSITSEPSIEATNKSQNTPCFLKRVNILKRIHDTMSFNATKFVDGIVGQNPMQKNKFEYFSSAKKNGQQKTNVEKDHSYLLDENPLLVLQVKEKRKKKFTYLLNKIMQGLMIDELQIEDMLNKINAENDERYFSELETRCYLTSLEELNRIMVSWDSQTIYRI